MDGTSPDRLADQVEEGLARATETLALRRASGDRFETYVRRLREAAAAQYPGPLPWKDERKRLQFYEAVAQCPDLVAALAFTPYADPRELADRLAKALAGPVLPADDGPEDEARSALFELSTAQLLRQRGFDVRLTADDGLCATFPGLPSLAVECARIAGERSWDEGLGRMRERLERRVDGRPRWGLPIIGRHRLQGASNRLRAFDDEPTLRAAVRATIDDAIRRSRQVQSKAGDAFGARVPVGIVVLATPVLLRRPGLLGQVLQVTPYAMGPAADGSTGRVLEYLRQRAFP